MDSAGYEPCHPVNIREGHAESAAGVADCGLGAKRAEGDDLCHVVSAVLPSYVGDHLVPAVVLEVHVNVRHLAAFQVEEPLEDQRVLQRIDVGHAEAVEDQACGGAAPHTEQDALLAGEGRNVPHDEHVVGELGLFYDVKLVVQALDYLVGGFRVAQRQAIAAQAIQVLLRRHAVRRLVLRQAKLREIQLNVAHLRDPLCVGDRLRQVGEELLHLLRALQVVGVVGHLEALFVVLVGVRVDADENVLDLCVYLMGVMAVVGGHERQARIARQLKQGVVEPVQFRDVLVTLQLEVEVVERVAVPQSSLAGVVHAAFQQELRHLRGGTAGEGDEARAVEPQQLLVHPGLVVEALQVGPGCEVEQIAIPLHVSGKQKQVIGGAIGRAFAMAAALGKVGLQANDWLDACLLAGGVEVDCAVQASVVGDGERSHAEFAGALNHRVDAAEAVEHAELGVVVEVDEQFCPGWKNFRDYSIVPNLRHYMLWGISPGFVWLRGSIKGNSGIR